MFRALEDIADDIAGELKASGLAFKLIDKAAVSSGEQLARRLHAVPASQLPAAIVCIGAADTENGGCVRKLTVAIVVLAPNAKTEAGQAAGILPLVEGVEALFLPEIDAQQTVVFCTIENVHYLAKGWTPVMDDRLLTPAYAVELELTDHL